MCDTVRNGREFLGHYQVIIVEGLFLQDLPVQTADAVDRIAHRDAHIGHMDIVITDNGHPGNAVPVSREEIPQPFTKAAVHLTDDLIASREQLLNHVHRPFLKCFRKNGMIRVSDRFLYDC